MKIFVVDNSLDGSTLQSFNYHLPSVSDFSYTTRTNHNNVNVNYVINIQNFKDFKSERFNSTTVLELRQSVRRCLLQHNVAII